jgi:hypothetical protein
MAGTIIIIIVLLGIFPVTILMSSFFASAALGHLLQKDVDATHEGSELFEISKKDFSN